MVLLMPDRQIIKLTDSASVNNQNPLNMGFGLFVTVINRSVFHT